jgi:hypothetical protein
VPDRGTDFPYLGRAQVDAQSRVKQELPLNPLLCAMFKTQIPACSSPRARKMTEELLIEAVRRSKILSDTSDPDYMKTKLKAENKFHFLSCCALH